MKNTKKIKEANKRKNKFKLPEEIVKIETVETSQRDVKVPVSVEKPKSSVHAAKKVNKKYDKVRREKAKKLALLKEKEIIEEDSSKKYTKYAVIAAKKISYKYKNIRKKGIIVFVEEIKDVVSKKSTQITARKISNKYKK